MCTFPTLCRNTVGSYECDCPLGYANKGPKQSARCEGIHSLTFLWNTVSPPKVDKSIRKLTPRDAPCRCSIVFVDSSIRRMASKTEIVAGLNVVLLRVLSGRKLIDGSFWKKVWFSEEFSLKKPSTLCILLRNWLITLVAQKSEVLITKSFKSVYQSYELLSKNFCHFREIFIRQISWWD